ncbi:MAG TPA: hypothetical protein DDW42_00170 [Desulfobacteraceae bacterium]|nr:hypothetical protein [Desulfobacteraceae bacterium]
MRNAGNIIIVLVCLLILAIVFSVVRPYWNKYWLKKDIETVALYGTKNKIEDIKKKLDMVMAEEGRDFNSDDFYIEKDEYNNVTIGIEYKDKIGLFGIVIKRLKIEVEVRKNYTNEVI